MGIYGLRRLSQFVQRVETLGANVSFEKVLHVAEGVFEACHELVHSSQVVLLLVLEKILKLGVQGVKLILDQDLKINKKWRKHYKTLH